MADDALTLTLSEYTASKLAEKATVAGIAPEQLAAVMLESQLFDYDDFTWLNGDPRDPEPAFDPNEPTFAWEDVKAELSQMLEDGLARQTRVAGQK